MNFPYWRYVQGTDDGCSIYQCLWCMASWESRSSPNWDKWKFCPVCGFEWKGEHECIEHGYRVYDICEKHKVEARHCSSPKWIVQSRMIDTEDGEPLLHQNWHKDSWEMDSLFQVYKYAKEKEAEENENKSFGIRIECRVARWYSSAKSYGCGDAVLPGEPISPALQKFVEEHTEQRSWGCGYVAIKLSGEIEAGRRTRNDAQSS